MLAMVGLESIGDDARWCEMEKARLRPKWQAGSRRAAAFDAMDRRIALYEARPRPWVARLGVGMSRTFLRGRKDYSQAVEGGARGVFLWYELPEGGVYEVNAPIDWTSADRYSCRSERGRIVRMTREEVGQWITSDASASTS
jgi:hypothetical protein